MGTAAKLAMATVLALGCVLSTTACATKESADDINQILNDVDMAPFRGIISPQVAHDMPLALKAMQKSILTTDHSRENIEKIIEDSGVKSKDFQESLHVMLIEYPDIFGSFAKRLQKEMGLTDEVIRALYIYAS